MDTIRTCIEQGKTALGIEFGSTRIKAVLIDDEHKPIASGSFVWENRYEDSIWTYHLDEVWNGLQRSYAELVQEAHTKYGTELKTIGAIGFSAMMHGYLPFDHNGKQLVPFRTWRNTMTGPAAEELTKLFHFNIPQRWSIAHLYQAILNQEAHVKDIAFLTTLAGYVHWKLTGQRVLGIGEASGMFPIDSSTKDYNATMIDQFEARISEQGFSWKLRDILPRVLTAGEYAGTLTEEGARLLDPTNTLQAGIPLCPPEGDAGTGMTATNSVAERTGNVSAGTSVFAMAVLEQELSQVYQEIDMVTTPSGKPVAMVHCNNCTNEINAWAELFRAVSVALGAKDDQNRLFTTLFEVAQHGDVDCGGLVVYNYLSGEPVTNLEAGRPLFVRSPDSRFTLANFMRAQLYSACATLKIGMDILFEQEHVELDRLLGHGGFFKTPLVGQRIMAAAMDTPVAVMETAGEGGAWGCALLAAYMQRHEAAQTLEDYLDAQVFHGNNGTVIQPEPVDVQGFQTFMKRYQSGLAVQRAAVDVLQ
ncbi:MAG: FGGY-family carbohydrate kinase [Eubacteriales bacterium]|nr:FGGY-family carbohydrate kinase [Eubacteriales bacterium]